jgi:phosphinothricin acetyltransferase
MDGTLRQATPRDAAAVRRIYAPYVEGTAISFATTVPTVETLEARIEATVGPYPWLVCERDEGDGEGASEDDAGGDDGSVVGYAYAGPLRRHDAYRWSVELSVYVAERARRQGVGRALYRALLDLLTAQGYASAYGVVTLPNPPSVAFHERLGFERVGRFDDVGYKFGAWHDVGWWRLSLPDPAAPEPPRPVDDLDAERVRRALEG